MENIYSPYGYPDIPAMIEALETAGMVALDWYDSGNYLASSYLPTRDQTAMKCYKVHTVEQTDDTFCFHAEWFVRRERDDLPHPQSVRWDQRFVVTEPVVSPSYTAFSEAVDWCESDAIQEQQ